MKDSEEHPPPMALKRSSTQLLISPALRERQVILAAVLGVSAAEVARLAMERAFPAMEDENEVEGFPTLRACADRWRHSVGYLAQAMRDDFVLIRDLEGADTYHDALVARDARRAAGVSS